MQIYKTLRAAALLKPLALTLAVLGACPAAWSQAVDVRRSGPGGQGQRQIFKGRGSARGREAEKETPAPKAPPKITAAQIASFLEGYKLAPTPGSTYVMLSIQTPSVANKGYLNFSQPHAIHTGENSFGLWGKQEQFQGEWQMIKLLKVSLKSEAAGRRYLFDCSVRAQQHPSEPFLLVGAGLEQTFAPVIPGGQHLLFVLETVDAGWYKFYISRNQAWYAYSCEVTNL